MVHEVTTPVDLDVLALPSAWTRRVHRWRERWTRADTAAVVLIGLQVAALLVLLVPGGLYLDDFRAQAYAQGRAFLPFVVDSNNTHLTPLPRALDWAQSRWFPLEHPPAVAVTVLVRLALGAATWVLLRRLVGPRPAALLPLALVLSTPALVPVTAWYRQSITALPATVCLVIVLAAFVAWVRQRRTRDLAMIGVATALGLGFYEKTAIAPAVLCGAAVALCWRPGRPVDMARSLRPALAPVLLTTVTVALFLLAYRSGPYDQGSGALPTPVRAGEMTVRTVALLLPALLGGPWRWQDTQDYYGTPEIDVALGTGTVVVLALALVLVTLRRPGQVGRAGVLLLSWLLPSAAVIAVGRMPVYGISVSAEYRLWADLVPLFAVTGTLCVLQWRVGVPAESCDSPAWTTLCRRAGRWWRPAGLAVRALAAALAVAVLVGSAISWAAFAQVWHRNPAQAWVESVRAALADAGPQPRLLVGPVPDVVVPGWVQQDLLDASLLALMRPDARFHDADGPALAPDAAGRLVATEPREAGRTPAPEGLCLATVPAGAAEPTRVALPPRIPEIRAAQVEVAVLVTATTQVDVLVQDRDGTVRAPVRFSDDVLYRGPHTMRWPMPLGVRPAALVVSARSPQAGLCIVSARVVWRQR